MTTEYTPTPQDLKTVQAPNVADQLGATLAAAEEAQRTAMGNPSDALAQEQAFALRTAAMDLTAQQLRHDEQRAYVTKQNEPVEAALRAQNDKQTNELLGGVAKLGLTAAFMGAAVSHGVQPAVVLGAGMGAGMGLGGVGLMRAQQVNEGIIAEQKAEEQPSPKKAFNLFAPLATMGAVAAMGPAVMMSMSPFSLFNSRSQKPDGLEGPQLDLAATGPAQKPDQQHDQDGGVTGLAMAARMRPKPSPMMEMSLKPNLITPTSRG